MGVNAVTSVPTYTDGEILEASRLNVTNSGIPVFATTTTRDAGFGGTGEKVLAEGQVCYIEAAPQRYQVYNGTAWKDFHVNYTDVSSTVTFGGFTKGNATVVSKYTRLGDYVHFYGIVYLGSTSSMTGPLDVNLPIASDGGTIYFPGVAWIGDATAGSFLAFTIGIGTTALRIVAQNTAGTYSGNAEIGATVPMTWAVSDQFSWNYFYKAA